MEIKFSIEKPPVYEKCREIFGADWDKGTVFTYGGTVHSKFPLTEDLKAHEATHVRQQLAMGKELWWERYLTDPEFRLSREVEAYRNQATYAQKHYDRSHRRALKKHIIKSMAGLYGSMCTAEEAEKLVYGK